MLRAIVFGKYIRRQCNQWSPGLDESQEAEWIRVGNYHAFCVQSRFEVDRYVAALCSRKFIPSMMGAEMSSFIRISIRRHFLS